MNHIRKFNEEIQRTVDMTLNLFGVSYKPVNILQIKTMKYYLYQVKHKEDYSVVLGIDQRHRDSVLTTAVNLGEHTLNEYTTSRNLVEAGWQLGMYCEFDECEEEISELIQDYGHKDYFRNLHNLRPRM